MRGTAATGSNRAWIRVAVQAFIRMVVYDGDDLSLGIVLRKDVIKSVVIDQSELVSRERLELWYLCECQKFLLVVTEASELEGVKILGTQAQIGSLRLD